MGRNTNPDMDPGCDGNDDSGCAEYREMSRREFLSYPKAASASALPEVVVRRGSSGKRDWTDADILVTCFWRGGADLLSQMIPYGDPWLYQAPYTNRYGETFPDGLRPVGPAGSANIGLNPPGAFLPDDPEDTEHRLCLPLGDVAGDLIGINKAYANQEWGGEEIYSTIFDLYQLGDVAFIIGAGSPDRNRSHFSAEAYIEFGTPNQPHDETRGWLARYLEVIEDSGSPLRGAALTKNRLIPKMFTFANKTIGFQTIDEVVMPGNSSSEDERRAILAGRYAGQTEDPLRAGVLNTFDIIDLLENVGVNPHEDAHYTNTSFGIRLKNAAALIKADIGVQAINLDRTSMDLHAKLAPILFNPWNSSEPLSGGNMYNAIRDWSQNLAAFRIDCQDFWHRITVICQSEFGRQNNQNNDFGTDHGNGGVMMVLGGHVNGGLHCRRRYYLNPGEYTVPGPDGFPSLHPDDLEDPDQIKVGIDYRAVFCEFLTKRAGLTPDDLAYIFDTTEEWPPPILDPLGILNE